MQDSASNNPRIRRWSARHAAASPMAAATVVSLPFFELAELNTVFFAIGSLMLASTLLAISVQDMRSLSIPDELTLALGLAGLLLVTWFFPNAVVWRLGGAAAVALCSSFVAEALRVCIGRAAFGTGDLKLLAALAIWTGSEAVPTVLLVAALSGLSASAAIRLQRGRPVRFLPFAPHLAAGAWFAWLCGPLVLH
jgi:leader peptidase (prepilin peptidase) / N-methyltransferase